ncbi:MAG: hypothetical protein HOK33_04545 [Rhodobiaceae bacterium]|nr:hypothetical protein [Rhodobiaceae bacterium]MBT5518191.1 hypothetical protein [Rhodobiaceae bacterium]
MADDENAKSTEDERTYLKLEVDRMTERIDKDPDDLEAYLKRSNAFDLLGEYENEIADLDEMIRLQPGTAALHCNRGSAFSFTQS